MNIHLETNFNLNDSVFAIYEDKLHNDWFSTETSWFVLCNKPRDYTDDPTEPCIIDKINIQITNKNITINYIVKGFPFSDKDLFATYEEALNECNKRNIK
jgi:hypothetical protein